MRKHPLALCEECPLQDKPCAPTLHARNGTRAAIVSRSPGYHEAIAGRPFSGPSGKVLDHLLKINGVTREDCLVTNTVLCAPDEGEVPPEAIKACAPRLHEELKGIGLVLACGREAVNLLVGRGAIDRYRGYHIQQDGRSVIATNNPALVLRDDSTFPNLKRDFRRAFHPPPDPVIPSVEVIEDAEQARDFIRILREHKYIACDIESRGGLTHRASLISIQFSTDGTRGVVCGERGGLFDDRDFIQNYLKPLLEERETTFIWHNGKFDCKILRHTYGIQARVDEDTMLLSYALDERSGTDDRIGVHGLDYLLMDEFGWPHYSSPEIEKTKQTGIVTDYDAFYEYAGLDVGGTYQLWELYSPRARSDDVDRAYRHLLLRGTELAIGIELHGMVYDHDRAADIYEFEVEPELRDLTEQMRQQVDMLTLNPRSPKQMAAIFYDRFQIAHAMRKRHPVSKFARSVDDAARKEILEDRFELGMRYEQTTLPNNQVRLVERADYKERKESVKQFVQKFDRFQEIQKQASTYLLGMIERAEQDADSRIYTQLNFHGTNSGRLSSSKPNLQNITRTKEGLPDIRKLFRASDGRLIVSADFSQAELRCIAHFSGDEYLTRIYRENLSLHKETAKRFYGENYTSEQYSTCKNVNFGVFYRQSAETFQEKHGIPVEQARPYIDWVWQTFKGVAEWERGVENEVRTKGILVSPFGRKRRFHLLTRENLQAAFREGINFYPQSTASDLTLCAAIRLSSESDRTRGHIGILVHDSITSEVDEDYVDEYAKLMVEIMEETAKDELGWTLPFKAEVGIGPTWGEAK